MNDRLRLVVVLSALWIVRRSTVPACANQDGSFTVTNSRNNFSKRYGAAQ